MELDTISTQLVRLALFLNEKHPGSVSEIWIDTETVDTLKQSPPHEDELPNIIALLRQQINELSDHRRQQYLLDILSSIEFQLTTDITKVSYSDFSEKVFGYRIERVTPEAIDLIHTEMVKLERQAGRTCFEVFKEYHAHKEEYLALFETNIAYVKSTLPAFVTDYPDNSFSLEVVTGKPWTAFNSHTSPFTSILTLNSDTGFTKLDLYKLASHEAYGGHHSELSHKDRLLTNLGHGEHGLVITYSPQVFVSEAIAEGMYTLLHIRDDSNIPQMMTWYYDRLIFALQNLATYMYVDDKLSKEEIDEQLKQYPVTEQTRQNILNFSTDSVFGRYAPIYYSAYDFIIDLYKRSRNKEKLLRDLFMKPCSPRILISN